MQFIAIAVRVLTVVRHLHIVVRVEETVKNGIVLTTVTFPASRQRPLVHVDDVKFFQYFMPCVAAVQTDGVEHHSLLALSIV